MKDQNRLWQLFMFWRSKCISTLIPYVMTNGLSFNILIIEDDTHVVDFLSRGLRTEGYGVSVARTGPEGLELARTSEFDLVLLDLRLPGMHGMEICQQLRANRVLTPILILTAMDTIKDKVDSLQLGADDYITKPFDFEELLARIFALIRRYRSFSEKPSLLQVADLSFDRESLQVQRGGHKVELTAKEMALLELLMTTPGRVFSRERILNSIWGQAEDPLTNIVDVYIHRLRNKIDKAGELSLIKTVRGIGYKLGEETKAP